MSISGTDCNKAVEIVRDHTYHPVKDYLNSLLWDGQPRIDNWLPTYFGADSTPLNRAIGSRWLVSAVAQIG
jgi:predicted P-loop ATPase